MQFFFEKEMFQAEIIFTIIAFWYNLAISTSIFAYSTKIAAEMDWTFHFRNCPFWQKATKSSCNKFTNLRKPIWLR